MKKVALILGVFGFSYGVFAQDANYVKQSDLKGPAYKNYQVWKDKSEPVKIYSQIERKSLQGPAYKNQQSLESTPKENLELVNTVSSERRKLTGPEFKNFGPWSKNF
jgi:hypothetical protein